MSMLARGAVCPVAAMKTGAVAAVRPNNAARAMNWRLSMLSEETDSSSRRRSSVGGASLMKALVRRLGTGSGSLHPHS